MHIHSINISFSPRPLLLSCPFFLPLSASRYHFPMPPPCNTSSLSDMNASSSLPSHNAVSHEQSAHVSQSLHEPPLVDQRWLPAVSLDASQPTGVFPNITVPTTKSPTSWFAYSASCTANTVTPTLDLIRPESDLHAHSNSLPSQARSFPCQNRRVLLTRHHSDPIIRTVLAQTEFSPVFLSSATEAQNLQQQQRSSQHVIQTVSADRGSAIADTGEHVSL
jgi:hypothetical protein